MKLLVLASGRGSDFQAIMDHEILGIFRNVKVEGLVCNHKGAKVIERAKNSRIDVFELEGVAGKTFQSTPERNTAREKFDEQCLQIASKLNIDLIVLAGFDQIVSKKLTESYLNKIINIHPAIDLIRFGGKNMIGRKVHELVIKSGDDCSGCTVHYVISNVDLGPPILKKTTRVLPNDTPESLEKRILFLEHLAYPEAIQLLADGRVLVDDKADGCFVDRYSGNWDLEWAIRQKKYLESAKETSTLPQ